MILGSDIEKYLASFLTLREIRNLSLISKYWHHLHSIFVGIVLDFSVPADLEVIYGPMPPKGYRAPWTVYVEFETKRGVSKSVTCIYDLPPISGGLYGTDGQELRTRVPPADDYQQRVNDIVYPHNKSTSINRVPLTQRFTFSFANAVHILTSDLPLKAPKMEFLERYQYYSKFLVDKCYANPNLAHSVMNNAYLRKHTPQIERFSSRNKRYLLNHYPRQNFILATYSFLFLALNGLYEIIQTEHNKSKSLDNIMISAMILATLMFVHRAIPFLQNYKNFHYVVIDGVESIWKHKIAKKIPQFMSLFPQIDYHHQRKTISLQQIADEYEQGINSEDRNQLFEQERRAFRLLLENEYATLSANKGYMHRWFTCSKNPKKDAIRLGHINTALEELSELTSHDEFIVFKAKLLRTDNFRGGRFWDLENDAIYNKMLSF